VPHEDRVDPTGCRQLAAGTGRELGRALAGPWMPFALGVAGAGRRRGVARRVARLMAAGIAVDWLTDRPALDPLTYAALRLADESARGAGIWLECLLARDFRVLRPRRPPDPRRR
jgi:mycofactocin glycosyltransferase